MSRSPSKSEQSFWSYACGPEISGWCLDSNSFKDSKTKPEYLFVLGVDIGVYVHVFPTVEAIVIAFGVFQGNDQTQRAYTQQFCNVCVTADEFNSKFTAFKVYATEWKRLIEEVSNAKPMDEIAKDAHSNA